MTPTISPSSKYYKVVQAALALTRATPAAEVRVPADVDPATYQNRLSSVFQRYGILESVPKGMRISRRIMKTVKGASVVRLQLVPVE